MLAEECRRRFAAARVVRLATADTEGRPHLVPTVGALGDDDVWWSAVDHKPKRTTALRRLANVEANPAVSLLADEYDDADWDRLWWVRADGSGLVLQPPEVPPSVLDLLASRYPQYRSVRPAGPVLAVHITTWRGWSASATGPGTVGP